MKNIKWVIIRFLLTEDERWMLTRAMAERKETLALLKISGLYTLAQYAEDDMNFYAKRIRFLACAT